MARSRQMADGVQTAVRMPRDLYKRLEATGGAGKVGEEIRARLERSFATGPVAEMQIGIAELVKVTEQWTGKSPLADPTSFAVFQAGLNALLMIWRPAGEPGELDPGSIADTFVGGMQNATTEAGGMIGKVVGAPILAGRKAHVA